MKPSDDGFDGKEGKTSGSGQYTSAYNATETLEMDKAYYLRKEY